MKYIRKDERITIDK